MSKACGKKRNKVSNVRFPDPSMMTPMYTVASCFGKDKNAAKENIHTFMPHVANTAVVTNKRDLSGRIYSERKGRRTVTWNSTETCDQGYSETTIADNTRETAVLQVCPFEFLSTCTTTILESTSRG